MKWEEAMKIAIVATLAALVFGGCATTPIRSSDAAQIPKERLLAFQEKTEKTTSTITITRDVGVLGSACYLAVRINGTVSARLDVAETSRFYVEPGEILLSAGYDPLGRGLCGASPGYWKTRETYLRPGEAKFYRLTLEPSGSIDIIRSEVE